MGTVDHWVWRPVQAPDEEFHRSVTEFLREWSSQRGGGGFEPVQVIGQRWSARSQELRDLFSRHRVPAGFYDAASGPGRQLLGELGLACPDLPVVVLRFAAERPPLVNPSNAEIADAPLPLETSLPGVFAAGDVRRGAVNRVASAVGEGAAAIPLVHRYLARAAAGRITLTGQHTRRGSPRAHHRQPATGLGTVPTPTEPAMLATPTR